MNEVFNVYPQLKLKENVDDVQLHVAMKNQEVLEAAPKVASKLKKCCSRSKVEVIVDGGRKEGKGKLTASKKFLESMSLVCGTQKEIGLTTWSVLKLILKIEPTSWKKRKEEEEERVCRELTSPEKPQKSGRCT